MIFQHNFTGQKYDHTKICSHSVCISKFILSFCAWGCILWGPGVCHRFCYLRYSLHLRRSRTFKDSIISSYLFFIISCDCVCMCVWGGELAEPEGNPTHPVWRPQIKLTCVIFLLNHYDEIMVLRCCFVSVYI